MSNGCFLWKASECSFYYQMCFLFLKIWMGRQNDKYRETWLMLWPSDHTHTNKTEDICIPHSWNYWVDVGDTHTVNTQELNLNFLLGIPVPSLCHCRLAAVGELREERWWNAVGLQSVTAFRVQNCPLNVLSYLGHAAQGAHDSGAYEMFSFLSILQSTLWIPQSS